MKRNNHNFVIFIVVLFLICFFMSRSKKEKFSNKFVDSWDFVRTEPESEIVEITKENESVGWKDFFRKNYSKGKVDYTDSFEGTMIRNYLDNLTFFKN